eukprot:TRINITY_DN703_c0_g1_i3.p1 TRINITY_DN703_c0_g1~~TRINITY_DN703_c0_g1_i3.p1  ORF type:complete len:344 (+),score=33.26 TRINITY_DN703_c0_g1_i3:215-1246(+)
MARVAVLLIAWVGFGFSVADDPCQLTTLGNTYDLKPLEQSPTNPHRFYTGGNVYKINFCGAAACSSVGSPTPGCQQVATAQDGVGETSIGDYAGMQSQPVTVADIQDINFKTGSRPTPFAPETKGVTVYYPAPGAPPLPGQPQGQPNGGQYAQPATPQYPAQPNQWATPTPPPFGRRLQQQQPFPQQQQQPQQGFPGQQPYGSPSSSPKALTVFILCNADMTGNARPIIFAPKMNYETRLGGFMFVMEHAAGCPVQENFIERATGGLAWGWTFLICLAIFLVIYCGCGIFYKTKKLGVTGIEAIPNIEFWRDYPSIVKEGCGYSMATLLNCVGKGNGGGYSTV